MQALGRGAEGAPRPFAILSDSVGASCAACGSKQEPATRIRVENVYLMLCKRAAGCVRRFTKEGSR